MGIRNPEIPRFRVLGLGGIYPVRIAVPRPRVHDCLSAISEPAAVDGAAPEGDSLERGRWRPRYPTTSQHDAGCEENYSRCRRDHPCISPLLLHRNLLG